MPKRRGAKNEISESGWERLSKCGLEHDLHGAGEGQRLTRFGSMLGSKVMAGVSAGQLQVWLTIFNFDYLLLLNIIKKNNIRV